MMQILRLSDYRRRRGTVYFTRAELAQLLSLYANRVASGEWRDYALDHGAGMAVFSVFRHSFDRPTLAIAKRIGPRGADYAVVDSIGKVTRGASLAEVLPTVRPPLRVVTD